MNFVKTLLASAALAVSFGASATVTGSLGGGAGSFLALSQAGLSNGAVATLNGGTVYNSDRPFADIPAGSVFGNNFLAVGPTAGSPSMLTFATAVNYVSFLWGSPDTYNQLTVNSTGGGSQVFTAAGLNFAQTNGNQGFSQYVQFAGVSGSQITSLVFTNVPSVDAFEVANFTITPVPEPETYALMLAGLGAMAMFARRRRAE